MYFALFLLVAFASPKPTLHNTNTVLRELPLPKTSYRAAIVLATANASAQGSVYYDHLKERREITINDIKQILIIRRDRNVMYLVLPAQKTVLELPLGDTSNILATGSAARDLTVLQSTPHTQPRTTRSPTTTYTFRTQARQEPGHPMPPAESTGTLWLNQDNIVTKIESRAAMAGDKIVRVTYTLSDVQRGTQPAHLFDIPAGYTKRTLPAAR